MGFCHPTIITDRTIVCRGPNEQKPRRQIKYYTQQQQTPQQTTSNNTSSTNTVTTANNNIKTMRSHSLFDGNKKRCTATAIQWSVVQRVWWTMAALLLLSPSSSSSRSFVVVNAQEATNSTTAVVGAGSGLAVRILFNQGVYVNGTACNDEQFDLIKTTIGQAAQQSLTFKALKQQRNKDNKKNNKNKNNINNNNKDNDRSLQSRAPINCAKVCCGYMLGMCGFYTATASCANFPTVASNRECPAPRRPHHQDRRALQSSVVDDNPPADNSDDDDNAPSSFADRHGKAQIKADFKLAKACRALEKEATIAITSILDLLDDNCADLALLPTLLECFFLDDDQ
jgi:hypothetical protein